MTGKDVLKMLLCLHGYDRNVKVESYQLNRIAVKVMQSDTKCMQRVPMVIVMMKLIVMD